MPFHDLPNEIILLIAREVNDLPDLNSLLRASRHLEILLKAELVEAVFRTHDSRRARKLLFSAASRADKCTCEKLICERRILDLAHFHTGAVLHDAISDDNITALRTLLECSGINVNELSFSGSSTLFHAVKWRNIQAVQVLLQRPDLNVNFHSTVYRSALRVAVAENYEELVFLLLADPRIDVNCRGYHGRSVLHAAARKGHESIVRALLSHRDIKVNTQTGSGDTPLHLAAAEGFSAVVRLLIADERVDVNRENVRRCSPLQEAAYRRQQNVVSILLSDERVSTRFAQRDQLSIYSRVRPSDVFVNIKVLIARHSDRCFPTTQPLGGSTESQKLFGYHDPWPEGIVAVRPRHALKDQELNLIIAKELIKGASPQTQKQLNENSRY